MVETCNGQDDNCDGQIDENNPAGGLYCSTGLLGACEDGVTACQNGMLVCNQTTLPSSEVCDGLDNDCDGTVDNAAAPGSVAFATPCRAGACPRLFGGSMNVRTRLKELVALPSTEHDDPRPILDYVSSAGRDLGARVTPVPNGDRPAVLLSWGTPRLLFSGHLDTVPKAGTWTSKTAAVLRRRFQVRVMVNSCGNGWGARASPVRCDP